MLLRWPSEPGNFYHIENGTNLSPPVAWSLLVTNLPAAAGAFTEFTHTNALAKPRGFYRVFPATSAPPAFVFDWSGTNFTYTDASRTFTGIMLKPAGVGPLLDGGRLEVEIRGVGVLANPVEAFRSLPARRAAAKKAAAKKPPASPAAKRKRR